jgi:hypothetical protein
MELSIIEIFWLNKMYMDWIIEKSTINKMIDDDVNDFPLIKNPNTIITNEAPKTPIKGFIIS